MHAGFGSKSVKANHNPCVVSEVCFKSFCDDSCREQQLPVKMDCRRRQAALSFLNNISLNGQPVEDHRIFDKAEDAESVPNTRAQIALEEAENRTSKEEFGGQTGRGRCLSDPHSYLKQTSQQGVSQENESSRFISKELQSKSASNVVRPRTSRRVHFIRNMRQHDTRNGRILLISARRALYGMFSVLPYRDLSQVIDERSDSSCQRSLSGASVKESVIGLDAVELDAKGKVSYVTHQLCKNIFMRFICFYLSDFVIHKAFVSH